MNAFEIVACIRAARLAASRIRHGHSPPTSKHYKLVVSTLKKRFEVFRKRAKRSWIREFGKEDFADHSGRWKALVRWISVHQTWCGCNPPRIGRSKESYQAVIEEVMAIARKTLRARGSAVPPDDKLRRLVRGFLAQGRRFRTYHPRHVVLAVPGARGALAGYIESHLNAKLRNRRRPKHPKNKDAVMPVNPGIHAVAMQKTPAELMAELRHSLEHPSMEPEVHAATTQKTPAELMAELRRSLDHSSESAGKGWW